MQGSKLPLALIPETPPTSTPCLSSGSLPSPLISPQLWVLPIGPLVHTITVDQNDGQHIILAQHSLRRLALSAHGDLRSFRALHKPSPCAGDRRANRRRANTGRDRAGLGDGAGRGGPEQPAPRRLGPRVVGCFGACVLRSAPALRSPHP